MPGRHGWHAVDEDEDDHVAAGQFVQLAAPKIEANVPGVHETQESEDVAATIVLYVPGEH